MKLGVMETGGRSYVSMNGRRIEKKLSGEDETCGIR